MTDSTDRPFVGRDEQLETLVGLLPRADDGPRTVLLDGEEGSGRRRLVTELGTKLDGQLMLRWSFQPEDDGVAVMLRLHGGLASSLSRAGALGSDVAATVRKQPSEDDVVAAWCEEFLSQLESGERDEQGGLQLRIPPQNPYRGLQHLLLRLATEVPMVMEFHQVNAACSPAFWTWFSRLYLAIGEQDRPVLWIVATTPSPYGEEPDDSSPTPSGLLMGLLTHKVDATLDLPGLDGSAIQALLDGAYRPNQFPADLSSHLAAITGGNPARLADLLDLLEREEIIVWGEQDGFQLTRSTEQLTIADIIPGIALQPAGEPAEGPPDQKEREDLARDILRVAALEGVRFTAGAVAQTLAVERDVVDDLLDEMPLLVTEVTHHEAVDSWIYRFERGLYRNHYLDEADRARGKQQRGLPGRLAMVLLDRYVPAAHAYIPVAARLLSQSGQRRRARNLLSLAMGSDRLDLSRFAMDLVEQDGAEGVDRPLLRLLHAEPAEKAVTGARPEVAEEMLGRLDRWIESGEDPSLANYTALLRSRLALRGQRLDEAITHAENALAGFREERDSVRAGETLNHLALLSLHRRDPAKARDYVGQATRESNIPPVKAYSLFIRGLLAKGQRKLSSAAESFGEAARLAGEAGNPVLGIEARINQGEALVLLGRSQSARAPLRHARDAAAALRALHLARAATALLSQAEAAAGDPAAAFELAQDTLDLTRQTGMEHLLAADLYHCGLFAVTAGKGQQALPFFLEARERSDEAEHGLRKEIEFHLGQMYLVAGELDQADEALASSLDHARLAGDRSREGRVLQTQGMVQEKRGAREAATDLYRQAIDRLDGPAHKKDRSAIRQHLAEMRTEN